MDLAAGGMEIDEPMPRRFAWWVILPFSGRAIILMLGRLSYAVVM